MAILTLKIEDADKDTLAALAKASEIHGKIDKIGATAEKIYAGENAIIIADRTRAIEQVKRLYAVIVGFSTVSFLGGAVSCLRTLNVADRIEAYGILISQGVCFFTLLILFVFGAERLLDLRYLQQDSPVPTWQGLFADVMSVLFTASWFAVLANLLPASAATPAVIGLPELERSQEIFVYTLIAVYAVDIIVLAIQAKRFGKKTTVPPQDAIWRGYHFNWLWINLGMLVLMALIAFYLNCRALLPYLALKSPQEISINAVSLILTVTHIGRFLLDLGFTHPFYYPSRELTPP